LYLPKRSTINTERCGTTLMVERKRNKINTAKAIKMKVIVMNN